MLTVKRRLMTGLPIDRIEDLMPDRDWVMPPSTTQSVIAKRRFGGTERYGPANGEAFLRRLGIFPSTETP